MSQTLEIGPDRGDLEVAPLAEGEEWASARLVIEADPTVTFSPPMEGPGPLTGPVPWVSVDWDRQRPLTGVSLSTTGLPATAKAMLKVATGGVWFTPMPPGKLHPELYQPIFAFDPTKPCAFPAVTASAALVEFNLNDPFGTTGVALVAAAVNALTVTVLNPVLDLVVRVGDRQLVAQNKGRLKGPLELDLLEALKAAAPGSPVQLRAAQAAEVRATLTLERVRRPSKPPPEPPKQAVNFNEEARWTQDLPPAEAAPLAEVSGRLSWAVQPQAVLFEPPEALSDASMQLLTPSRRVAQALPAVEGVIAGVDLWVEAAKDCSGRLSLCQERKGRPGEPQAVTAWSLAAGQSGWVCAELEALPKGVLWLVIALDEGEAYAPRTTLDAETATAVEARGGRPWADLETYTDEAPRPHLRVRLREDLKEPPSGLVTVHRGGKTVSLQVAGAFALDAAQLAHLSTERGALTVTAKAPGVGEVSLRDWVVRLG